LPDLITAVDHVLVGVNDLDAAREAWSRLGFTLTPTGRHLGWGTANACIMFAGDYLELIGIVDPGQFVNDLDQVLAERGEGLLGVAFATPDAAAAHRELESLGITEAPARLGRRLEDPAGAEELWFQVARLVPGGLPAVNGLLCQHLTPAALRRPGWLEHPNGVTGIDSVTIVVERAEDLVLPYRSLFGANAVETGHGRADVRIGPHALRFLSLDRFARRYPGMEPAVSLPCAAVVTLRCRDLLATRQTLTERGIRPVPAQGLRLVVAPTAATGTIVEFQL